MTYDFAGESFLVLHACADGTFDPSEGRVFKYSLESSYFPELNAPSSDEDTDAEEFGALGNFNLVDEQMKLFTDRENALRYLVVNREVGAHTDDAAFPRDGLDGRYPNIGGYSGDAACGTASTDAWWGAYYVGDQVFAISKNGFSIYGTDDDTFYADSVTDLALWQASFTCKDVFSSALGLTAFSLDDWERGLVWGIHNGRLAGGLLDLSGCTAANCFDISTVLELDEGVDNDILAIDFFDGYAYYTTSWQGSGVSGTPKVVHRVCAKYPGKSLACDGETGEASLALSEWESKSTGIRGIVADSQGGAVYVFATDSIARIPTLAFSNSGGNSSLITYTYFEDPLVVTTGDVLPDITFDPTTGVAAVVDTGETNTFVTFLDLAGCGGEYKGATEGIEAACGECEEKPGCVWCGTPRGCVRGSEATGAISLKGDCPVRLGGELKTCAEAETFARAQDAFWRWFWVTLGVLATVGAAAVYIRLNPPQRKADLTPLIYGGMEKAPVGEMARRTQRNKLVPLERLLLSKDMELVQASMSGISITNLDEFARATTFIYASQGEFLRLLRVFIKKELEKADSASGVFRSNSVASKLMGAYARLVGMKYLHATLGPLIAELMKQEGNLELDPNRIAESDDEHVNKWTLMATCQRALNDIMASLPKMPVEFRILAHDLKVATTKRFPDSNNTAVGGFLFLRFLCPAITSPDSFELVQGPVGDSQRRLLVLVAKTLQNLANGVEFGTKEVYMAKLNEFIQLNLPKIKVFFDNVSTIPAGSSKNLPQARIPAKITEVSIIKAHRLIHMSRAEIGAIMTPAGRDNLNSVLDKLGEPVDENVSGPAAVRGADFTMSNIKTAVTGTPAAPAPPRGGSKRTANDKRSSVGSNRTAGSKRAAGKKGGSQGSKGSKGSQGGRKAPPGGGAKGSTGSKRGGGGSAGSKRGGK